MLYEHIDHNEAFVERKRVARATDKLFDLLAKQHPEHGFKPRSVPARTPKPVAKITPIEPHKYSARAPIWKRIIEATAQEFSITPERLVGAQRNDPLPTARFVAVGLFSELTDMSLPSIARRLGGRDHTTILHARKKIKKMLAEEAFRNRFDQIKARLR